MLNVIAPLNLLDDEVLLVVRIIMGTTMIYYGWPKIKDLEANAKDFAKMGFKPGMFWGTIVALVEFVGGFMIFLGWYAWIVALLMVGHMATGTIWKITKTSKPFTDWSYDLLLLALALTIVAFGSGSYHVLMWL